MSRPDTRRRRRQPVRPIAAAWLNYLRRVIAPTADATQITDCKAAFYAGAAFVFAMVERSTDATVDDATLNSIATAVHQEIDDYKAELTRRSRAQHQGGDDGD